MAGAQLFMPLVKPLVVSQPIFSSSFAPAAHAVSGQPHTPVVGQEVGGTTQGRGVAIEVTGRIIDVFRGHRYGYIRSEEGDDFFFGRAEYRPLMSVGDVVKFKYDPSRLPRGTCPMAVDITYLTLMHRGGSVHSKGGQISGAQPAALASTNSWKWPSRTYRDATNRGRVGSSMPNTATQLGATAKVINGAVKFGVKNDVDVRLDSMQSLLERLDKDSTSVKQMLESLQRQRALVPS